MRGSGRNADGEAEGRSQATTALASVTLVEDDEPLRSLWWKYLSRARDFQPFDALACAEDALIVFRERLAALLVADFRLPGTDGIQLVQRFKRQHPRGPD